MDITIDRDTATATDDIITVLNSLPVSAEDRERLDRATGYMESVQNRAITTEKDIDRNIQDILKAINSLLSITSADVTEARLLMDSLLRIWEGRYYYRAE